MVFRPTINFTNKIFQKIGLVFEKVNVILISIRKNSIDNRDELVLLPVKVSRDKLSKLTV